MNRRVFTIYNVLGALIWAVGVTMLGYALGNAIGGNIDNVPAAADRADHPGLVDPGVPRVARARRAASRAPRGGEEPGPTTTSPVDDRT